jgi:hypothetical protein
VGEEGTQTGPWGCEVKSAWLLGAVATFSISALLHCTSLSLGFLMSEPDQKATVNRLPLSHLPSIPELF